MKVSGVLIRRGPLEIVGHLHTDTAYAHNSINHKCDDLKFTTRKRNLT